MHVLRVELRNSFVTPWKPLPSVKGCALQRWYVNFVTTNFSFIINAVPMTIAVYNKSSLCM